MQSKLTPEQRFWNKVDPCRTDGCAIWMARIHDGYGRFYLNGKEIQAHHFLVGEAPAGLEWDHLCRVRSCVWPEHLEAVTRSVNRLRGYQPNKAKTHCPRGHAYDEANTQFYKSGRNCRECDRLKRQKA